MGTVHHCNPEWEFSSVLAEGSDCIHQQAENQSFGYCSRGLKSFSSDLTAASPVPQNCLLLDNICLHRLENIPALAHRMGACRYREVELCGGTQDLEIGKPKGLAVQDMEVGLRQQPARGGEVGHA